LLDVRSGSSPNAANLLIGLSGSNNYFVANNNIFQDGASNEKARIDSSGRLLVGTSSSASDSLLQIQGVAGSSTDQGAISLRRGYTPISDLGAGSTIGKIDFEVSNGGVGARIAAEGDAAMNTNDYPSRLVFSTTADGASSPTERMRITSVGEVRLNTGVPIIVPYAYATTTASAANVFVGTDGNIFRSTSSRRWKTDIEDLQPAFADQILNCRPVWYRSTSDKDNPEWGYWGFIAEEVAEVDPRLVFWKTHDVVKDEDGNESTVQLEEPLAEGVQYDRFVPHLLNLIKRQGEAIADLQAKVAALEGV
jgi:hypothetical protein